MNFILLCTYASILIDKLIITALRYVELATRKELPMRRVLTALVVAGSLLVPAAVSGQPSEEADQAVPPADLFEVEDDVTTIVVVPTEPPPPSCGPHARTPSKGQPSTPGT